MFYQWINQENNNYNNKKFCKRVKKHFKFNSKEDLFFSFNYTTILEKYYKIEPNNICHIHGICEDDSSIIYGANKNKHTKYSYKKYSQDLSKISQKQYLEIQANKLTEGINETISSKVLKDCHHQLDQNKEFFHSISKAQIEEIIIIGHSINEIDLDYYKEIHKFANAAVWKIYYHNIKNIPLMINRLQKIGIDKDKIIKIELPNLKNTKKNYLKFLIKIILKKRCKLTHP